MTDDINDQAKGEALVGEPVETSHQTPVRGAQDDAFRDEGEGEPSSDVFWADSVSVILHQTHPRVPTLKTEFDCIYKFENGRIHVRTYRYKMTTRFGNWYRANIDVGLQAGEWHRENSPDEMLQDNDWHSYVREFSCQLGSPDKGVSLSIRVDYDGTNNDVEPHEGWGIPVYPSQTPIIEVPASGATVEMPFIVSGKNGLVQPDPLIFGKINLLCKSNGNVITLGSVNVGRDGHWNASIELPSGINTFYAEQVIGDQKSRPSPSHNIIRAPAAPTIISPEANSTITVRRPLVAGNGRPGAIVRIYQSGSETILFGQATVNLLGIWSTVLQHDLPDGAFVFTANQTLNGVESPWARDVPVTVRARLKTPTITSPAANTLQSSTFTVSGSGGEAGAKVDVLLDIAGTRVGQSATLTGDAWSASVTVSPGPVSLVAKQIEGQLESSLSAPRAFKIRPPALSAVTATPSGTGVQFTGAGHIGATVQLSVVSGPGGTAPPVVTVTSGRWETTAPNWPFGTYSLSVIQKVSDNAGGWIESQPYTFTVNHTFPNPSDVAFTADYRPTFSGKGLTGATVRLYDVGGTTPLAPDAQVNAGQWSVRVSQEWGPTWQRSVRVRQVLNGQESNDVTVSVTIPPLAPTINAPVEDGLSPQLSGTCWPGAVVNIKFSDSATVHTTPGAAGAWSFRRSTDFAPEVTHTVTVTQTAANQTSSEVRQTFSVAKPVPKPVITYPANNAEVGRDLNVRGQNGMSGATLQLRDVQFDKKLGDPITLSRDGEWSVDLRTLDFRTYAIDAQQVRNNRPSERSDRVDFKVVLLSPVIQIPAEGQKLSRTSTLSGTGMPGGRVEVMLRDPDKVLLSDLVVGSDGRWQGEVTLPVGNKVLTALQAFEGEVSQHSARRAYSVVPPAPYVETPAADEHVGRRVTVSGFATPGDTVSVRLGTGQHSVQAHTPVLEDRTWSVSLDIDVPGGRHGVVAVASSEGFDSLDSATRTVRLGTFMPVFEQPAPGRWVASPVLFAGQGKPGNGRVLSWYNPDLHWAPAIPVTTVGWQGTAQQGLPTGGNWCRFVQDINEGATVSDWADSQRFEVPPE